MNKELYERLKREFDAPEYREYVKAVKGSICTFCGDKEEIEYHHIIPLSQGGDNRINNVIPLCRLCHIKAHGKSPIEGKTYKKKGRL